MNASTDQIAMLPGLGEVKAKRLIEAFKSPFLLKWTILYSFYNLIL